MTKGFTLLREENLPEYNGTGTLIQHKRTGMKIFYFKPEKNNENYFSFNFKTPLSDDSGVAHALEHIVFQGSEKYPVKNMYFHLSQKALASKLNGFTAQYHTLYCAESYIPEEYYRLMEVFGDAVFFPLLDEKSFKQEVWRLDLDNNKKPFINGVVFNEMSSSDYISSHNKKYVTKKLFQNSEAAYNSGGDFLEIPELTRDKLSEFHRKYYTPSNCLLFLFGKLDLDEQLSFLEEHLLNRLPGGTSEVQIKDEIIPLPSMSEIKIGVPYRGTEESSVDLAILCKNGKKEDFKERDFFVNRIDALLNKQLKYCKVGKFTLVHSFSPHHECFNFYLRNVKSENLEKAKALLLESLSHCLDDGMDFDELKTAVNEMEFNNPRFLHSRDLLEESVTGGWALFGNPFEDFYEKQKEWENLKEKVLSYNNEDFNALLKKFFVNNPNKVFIIRTPDKEYFSKIEAQRSEVLQKKLYESGKSISDIEKDKIEFENFFKQDDSVLVNKLFPTLKLKEIKITDDVGIDDVEEIQSKSGQVLLFSSAQETGERVHVTILFAVDQLSEEELQQLNFALRYASYFDFDGAENSEKLLKEKVPNMLIAYNIGSEDGTKEIYQNRGWCKITFRCYKENLNEGLDIFARAIYLKNFKDTKAKNYAKEKITKSFKIFNFDAADSYATLEVSSHCSKRYAFDNLIYGPNSLNVKKENLLKDINCLAEQYQSIYEKIIKGSAIVNVFCDKKNLDDVKTAVKNFVAKTEIKPLEENKLAYFNEQIFENGKRISTILTQVSSGSVRLSFRGSKYGSKEFAVESALLQWFRSHILYKELRKLHGVYACFSSINADSNLVRIATMEDPAPDKSLAIIEACLKKIANLENDAEITEDYVKEIGLKKYAAALGDIEPFEKGKNSFERRLTGHTPKMHEDTLKYTLEMTRQDFIDAGKRLYENSKNFKACIITGDESQVCGDVICDMRKLSELFV